MRRHGSKNAFLLDNNAVITQSSFTLDLLKGHICCFVNTCASLKTQGRKMTCVSEQVGIQKEVKRDWKSRTLINIRWENNYLNL